jgi:uncharacterized BrkB/YihY/UPF0761 family membrane protein
VGDIPSLVSNREAVDPAGPGPQEPAAGDGRSGDTPGRHAAPTADVDLTEGKPGRHATGGRAAYAYRRAKAGTDAAKRRAIEIGERERGRRRSVAAAYEVGQADRQQAGALLAGGLAFRLFLWLLPLSLLFVAVVGLFHDLSGTDPADAAKAFGLGVAFAGTVAKGVEEAGRASIVLLILALYLLALASASAARSFRLVSAVAWRMPAGKRAAWLKSAGVFTGITLAIASVIPLSRPLFSGALATDILAWVLMIAGQGAVAWYAMTLLPRPSEIRPVQLVPGAVLFTVGLAILRLVTTLYFAPHLGSVTDLYGSLGLSAVFLTWLYLLGRLAVAGLMLNAILARRERSLDG